MVIQKTAVYKVLAIILALSLFLGSSERVEAAELPLNGTFDYNGVSYPYYYSNHVYSLTYNSGVKGYYHVDFSSNVYFLLVRGTDRYPFVLAVSDESFYAHYTFVNNGSIVRDSGTENSSSKIINGKSYYYMVVNMGVNNTFEIPEFQTSYSYSPTLMDPFLSYFAGEDFDDLLFSPDFYNSVGEDPIFQLDNFQADIVDGNLVMVWEQPKHLPYRLMQNMYIQFQYAHRDPETYQVGRVKYIDLSQYAKVSAGSITIPLSEIDTLPDNHQVSSIVATPYYYYADDLESGEMVRGQSSQVYFDINGLSSAPILVNPDIKEEIPEENVENNIFQSINNFFSGFFRNLQNTIKSAVVPSGDDVLALLQEMNDWFSERFGFIWYPFDLAIDIVGAFALGDADSKITVPALTLNMLGGIKLWDSFEADLDPIGFMEYVRFFTSAIMCCGTVSLAIRKWDEWIGGEH